MENILKFRLLSYKLTPYQALRDDSICTFELTVEEKRWWYFGKTKIVKITRDCDFRKADAFWEPQLNVWQ